MAKGTGEVSYNFQIFEKKQEEQRIVEYITKVITRYNAYTYDATKPKLVKLQQLLWLEYNYLEKYRLITVAKIVELQAKIDRYNENIATPGIPTAGGLATDLVAPTVTANFPRV